MLKIKKLNERIHNKYVWGFTLILWLLFLGLNGIKDRYLLQRGLKGDYYDNPQWQGTPVFTAIDKALDLRTVREKRSTFPQKNYSIQWTGWLYAWKTGEYVFEIRGDDGFSLAIDGQQVADNRGAKPSQLVSQKVTLKKGFHPLTFRYFQHLGISSLEIYWTGPRGLKIGAGHRSPLSSEVLFPDKPSHRQFRTDRRFRIFLQGFPIFLLAGSLFLVVGAIRRTAPAFPKKLLRFQKAPILILIVIFFSTVFLLLLSANMQRGLDHDEHQFIASGALLARKLLIPHRDYPYFHVPNLAFVYAILFKYTDYILLAARVFSTACAWLSLGLIFYTAFHLFHRHPYPTRFLIAAGGAIFLLTNPLFLYTSGRAWNHDLPILLILLAFIFHCRGIRQEKAKTWIFLSGILLGFAMGARLLLAPAVIPFLAVLFLYPLYPSVILSRRRPYLLLLFGLGIFLTMLPTLLVLKWAPEQFIFGMTGYAQLSQAYHQEMGRDRAMNLSGKLLYLKEVLSSPGNLLLVLGFTFFVFSKRIVTVRAKATGSLEIIFILILIPFLLIGSLAPTPSWPQYFYAPVPFLILGILYGIAALYDQNEKMRWSLKLFALMVIVSGFYGFSYYRSVYNLLSPHEWVPTKVHKIGQEIETALVEGKVLTFAPIFPLEGGLEIYEEFATGPFAWRTAPLLPKHKRKALGVISEEELRDFLKTKPPRGILVGFEAELEKPLVNYARERGYTALNLSNGTILWLSSD